MDDATSDCERDAAIAAMAALLPYTTATQKSVLTRMLDSNENKTSRSLWLLTRCELDANQIYTVESRGLIGFIHPGLLTCIIYIGVGCVC